MSSLALSDGLLGLLGALLTTAAPPAVKDLQRVEAVLSGRYRSSSQKYL